mgnify:CR=1 FL=1
MDSSRDTISNKDEDEEGGEEEEEEKEEEKKKKKMKEEKRNKMAIQRGEGVFIFCSALQSSSLVLCFSFHFQNNGTSL